MGQLERDSIAARFALSMVPTAGILYANLAPLIVSSLEQQPNFTPEAAGLVVASNMYGTTIGGLLVVALVRALPWRLSCTVLAALIAATDLTSIWVDDPFWLATIRFIHGLVGGAIMGFGSLLIVRAGQADRTFGIMIALQMLLGGLLAASLAPLMSSHGVFPVWLCLVGYSLLVLCVIPFLSDYEELEVSDHSVAASSYRAPMLIVAIAGFALFTFQAGQMAAYAYIYEIAQSFGFSDTFIGWTNAAGIWVGAPAALFAAYWSTRSGYVRPGLYGCALAAFAVAGLVVPSQLTYVVASLGLGMFFSFVIPYLLALVAEMDRTGRLASFGSFLSSFGLATGPFLAAVLLSMGAGYKVIVWFGAVLMLIAAFSTILPGRYLEKVRLGQS